MAVPDASHSVNFSIDFTDHEDGTVDDWLQTKGFKFERDAKNRQKIDLFVDARGLNLDARTRVSGFLFRQGVDLKASNRIRVDWGVSKYPRNTGYELKKNNEALMVYVFFGYAKTASGSLIVPDSPYFIGLYLGEADRVNKPYKGRYFHKGGRFVCLGNPEPGEAVVSQFDLRDAFRSYFGKTEVPLISGVSLGVDTTAAADRGRAAAFIRRIEFLEPREK